MSPLMVQIDPKHPCDRCGHESRYHAGADRGSYCLIVGSKPWHGRVVPKGMKAHQCLCNGYFPKP